MSIALLHPLGFRIDGRPIWGYSGAEGEGEGGDDDKGGDPGEKPEDEPETDLAKVQKALAAEREAHKASRAEARGYRTVLRDAGVTGLDALKDILSAKGKGTGASGDQTIDISKITREAESKATRAAQNMIALAKIEVRASMKAFADPDDVVAHFRDNAEDFVGDDGKPDVKHIDRELETLAAKKPHWVKKEGPATDFDLGARGTASGKASMDDFLRSASRNKRGN